MTRAALALLPALVWSLACAQPAARPASSAPAAESASPPVDEAAETELVRSLVGLGEQALAAGDVELAARRFERALAAQPGSVRARLGLARAALGSGDPALARARLEEILAADPAVADALSMLAELEEASGEASRARTLLEEAVAAEPGRPDLHLALARVTGDAPRVPVASPEEAERVALAHPYDPWAGVRAARAWLARGEKDRARKLLEGVWWLADRDPAAGLESLALLRELDPHWAERRIVPVHSYADETVRRERAWRMRLRLLWANLSHQLEPVLGTAFVPLSMQGFSAERASPELASIERAWLTEGASWPDSGLLAAFTERPPPARPGTWRLGQASFLGRRLLVRLDPGAVESRTLIHEVLHLYGAVHIAEDVDSLMNPSGDSLRLDPGNHAIVRLVADRRFGAGSVDDNVLARVDEEALTRAYASMLRANLLFRRLGIEQVLEARESSRYLAAEVARDARSQDEHLADVARFVSHLFVRQERLVPGIRLLELASRLYGPGTRAGREARARADRLRRAAIRRYGLPTSKDAR